MTIFLEKIPFDGQTIYFLPPSVIHRWKAMDLRFLMVFLKKYFFDPAKRQNFGKHLDRSVTITLNLKSCHEVGPNDYNITWRGRVPQRHPKVNM